MADDGTGSRWRLTCAGDWLPRDAHVPAMLGDPAGFYTDLLPHLAGADLRIVNVEGVLGEDGDPIPKAGPNLRAPEDSVAALSSVPFDLACLANNHCLDFGGAGLSRTMRVLEGAGLATVGAGPDSERAARPFCTSVRGVDVAVVNCAEGEACRSVDGGPGAHGLDVAAIASQVAQLKADGAVVVVIFHGGREHVPVPPPYVVHDLRAIAGSGADVVIANHPHVPQPVEVHGGVPIAYSLGNFGFLSGSDFYHRAGYLLHVDFDGSVVAGFEVTPYRIEDSGLRVAGGTERARLDAHLYRVSAVLADDAAVTQAWNAVCDRYWRGGQTPELLRRIGQVDESSGERDTRSAALIANLFRTPAHRELLDRTMHRVTNGTVGDNPAWADELLADFWEEE